MKQFSLLIVLLSLAGTFHSLAQEPVSPDSLIRNRDRETTPLILDSLKLQQNQQNIVIPPLEIQGIEFTPDQDPLSEKLDRNVNDTIKDLMLILPPKFKPHTYFNLGASRWTMPLVGDVTTFTPTLTYQAAKDLSFYGGVSFSQFHNLSYVQSFLMPGLPVKSNIISNAFLGAEYRLYDRIILHGSYQRSLYNQLPSNLMLFAPGQNAVVTGVSVDIWNGLGATIDHVWEFDRYGNMRRGFRYSPYIDVQKFIKFLRQ